MTDRSLDVAWIHGAPGEPAIQVHRYDDGTVILRQSKRLNYEAPFLFLLFGADRALLLDTGATEDPAVFPLRETVDGLVAEWLERHPREDYELVVAHTHGHGDHVAGDAQFADRPFTRVVAREAEAVREFFGFGACWPTGSVRFDLGGRELTLIGSPGHHAASVTVHDPATGFLLTGDTVLPGRLYAFDFPAFVATLDRLVAFTAEHPVTHVIGCHVEMSTAPGYDYPIGARYQPDERAPQMTPAQLTAVRDASVAVAGRRGVHRFDDFVVYNEPRRRDMLRLTARGLANKAADRLRLRPRAATGR
ncbi:MBL fold metallo-hydrolase [Streptacidiphilus neutrinimicus]|uniref:MBL fold metallo-hydrolase n=1 Tax=Streptacidiphilus neutrinimicus TaxID=105420 RepID=UPI001F309A06|nr:MBL fold metallo-hydrolase [Streptacidiphilus neutrinimicus]